MPMIEPLYFGKRPKGVGHPILRAIVFVIGAVLIWEVIWLFVMQAAAS